MIGVRVSKAHATAPPAAENGANAAEMDANPTPPRVAATRAGCPIPNIHVPVLAGSGRHDQEFRRFAAADRGALLATLATFAFRDRLAWSREWTGSRT